MCSFHFQKQISAKSYNSSCEQTNKVWGNYQKKFQLFGQTKNLCLQERIVRSHLNCFVKKAKKVVANFVFFVAAKKKKSFPPLAEKYVQKRFSPLAEKVSRQIWTKRIALFRHLFYEIVQFSHIFVFLVETVFEELHQKNCCCWQQSFPPMAEMFYQQMRKE